MDLRDLMPKRRRLAEIEIGGEVDSDLLDRLRDQHDFTPKQGTLFPGAPSEPALPKTMMLVGRIGGLYVTHRSEGGIGIYYLFDSGKPVAYVATIHPKTEFGNAYPGRLSTDPYLHGEGLRVISVYLDPAVRKQGVSVALYEWLLRNACDYILPDDMQTRGGVHIWKQLLRDPRFEVMIFNHAKHDYYKARPGVVWANVYRTEALRPFVTLAGKADDLIDDR